MEEMERAEKEEEECRRAWELEEKKQKREQEQRIHKKIAEMMRIDGMTDFDDLDFYSFCVQHRYNEDAFTQADRDEIRKMLNEPEEDDWRW